MEALSRFSEAGLQGRSSPEGGEELKPQVAVKPEQCAATNECSHEYLRSESGCGMHLQSQSKMLEESN